MTEILGLAMPLTRRLFTLAVAVVIVLAVLEMIRRRKLREEFALLWLLACLPLLVFGIFPWTLIALQDLLQVNYLTIVVLLGFGFGALILLHMSAALSRRTDDARRLSQSVALLEKQLRERTGEQDASEDSDSGAGSAGEGDA